MPSPSLRLTHPKKFETKTLSTKDVKDPSQKVSQRYDNKVLQAQAELVKNVTADQISLATFCDTVKDLEIIQTLHARYRADGFTKKEAAKLNFAFKRVGQDRPQKIDPELKSFYQSLKAGTLKADEVTEELNWRSSKRYGEEAIKRKGPIFNEERYKFRTAVHVPRPDALDVVKKDYIHPGFPNLVQKTINVFDTLDQNEDGIVDRREARSLLTSYEALGLNAAEATTIYSRHKQLASAIDHENSAEELKMEDLQILLPGNFPKDASKELKGVVSKVSQRLAHQLKTKTPEMAKFKLGTEFDPSMVKQGREGSCWFLCNLPALSEEELAKTVKPEGEGFRVTLNDGRTTFVDGLNEAERRVYSSGDGAWSALLEKGVAQILHDENKDLNGGYPRVGREMLSGQTSAISYLTKAPSNTKEPDFRDRDILFQTMDSALDNGSAIFCGTVKDDYEEDVSEISTSGHAYTVLDVDRENDSVIVRNPWGKSERADIDGKNDGVFELTQDQFFANYSYIYMDKEAAS